MSNIFIDTITPTTPVTFKQYYSLLSEHDWFYSFSDSSSVYSLGMGREGTLSMLAKRHDFAAYMMAHFCLVRRDAIVTPSKYTNQPHMTLVELKAKWDAMPRVNLVSK
jgi:hypothetical protein